MEEDDENVKILLQKAASNVSKSSSPSSKENENADTNQSSQRKLKSVTREPKFNALNEQVFPCDICNIDYKSSSGLRFHNIKNHNMGSEVTCELCHKSFARLAELKTHKRLVHEKEKRFFCDVCHKGFFQEQSLIRHKRIHTGETF
eukprot:TRINITY_DN7435_c0_g1_i4.p1 TRINITY_DN7435_c0_g1~~TRINITY_DN7435_c0_g1_i4.p1  ORF type:complete len:146 (+),score=15.68 TRINITY_DN7435_c0_g1_i4:172-609(+)